MSRVNIIQDIPAQICWKYIHGDLSKADKEKVRSIISIAIPNRLRVNKMIWEIAYRIGFVKSEFAQYMSETTYKKKKQWIRNFIEEEVSERREE